MLFVDPNSGQRFIALYFPVGDLQTYRVQTNMPPGTGFLYVGVSPRSYAQFTPSRTLVSDAQKFITLPPLPSNAALGDWLVFLELP